MPYTAVQEMGRDAQSDTDVLGHVENNPHPLGVLDPRYSVGMHRPLSGDRYILSEDEAFCRESKAKLVVVGSFDIVEIPLPTRLAAKMANPFGLTIVERLTRHCFW